MKSTVTEMKKSLEEFKVIFEQAEGRVSKLENRKMGIIKSEEQEKKKKRKFKKSEQILRDLWDIIMWNNLHIVRVQQGEE